MAATPEDRNAAAVDRVLIVTGGDDWHGPLPRFGAAISHVIAADSGIELALDLGLPVDVVVGDLDSASPESLEEAEQQGARIERHPRDKDATDLELAMDLASNAGAREIVVVGGAGGRLSHLLGIASLLASDRYGAIALHWLLPHAATYVVNNRRTVTIDGRIGDIVSLIAMGGGADGITTSGLRWVLRGESLQSTSTRGISNELVASSAEISVTSGTLLAIHEGDSLE